MASLQKYFDYSFGTECGIPGVYMTGSEEDWIRLAEKTKKLETLLMPIMDEIGLGKWSVFRHLDLEHLITNTFSPFSLNKKRFAETHRTLAKLLDTYRSVILNKLYDVLSLFYFGLFTSGPILMWSGGVMC